MLKPDWDKYYEMEATFKNFLPEEDPSESHRVRFALALIPKRDIKSVLDVGCGDGYLCSQIKKRINAVSGIDLSKTRIDSAITKYPGIEFVQGSVYDLPYEENSRDLVTAVETIEHLENPVAAIKEMRRVSKKYVLITVPYKKRIREVLCPYCFKKHKLDGHLHSFDEKELVRLCSENGLKMKKIRRYSVPRPFEERLGKFLPGGIVTTLKRLLRFTGLISEDIYMYLGVLCDK